MQPSFKNVMEKRSIFSHLYRKPLLIYFPKALMNIEPKTHVSIEEKTIKRLVVICHFKNWTNINFFFQRIKYFFASNVKKRGGGLGADNPQTGRRLTSNGCLFFLFSSRRCCVFSKTHDEEYQRWINFNHKRFFGKREEKKQLYYISFSQFLKKKGKSSSIFPPKWGIEKL